MTYRIRIYCLFILLALAAVNCIADNLPVRLVHTDRPISIALKVGMEQRFVFPEPVNVDIPQQVIQSMTIIQPTEHVVYWTPTAAFPAVRIIARSLDQQRVYLIDVAAEENATSIDVVLDNPALLASTNPSPVSPELPQPEKNGNPFQVELTRYVSQLLYAPIRLQPRNAAIRQMPTPKVISLSHLMQSQRGESYGYRLVGQWRGYGHHIAAVEISNLSNSIVELDLRLVRGNWIAITAQHTWIGPAKTPEDRTTLYLISKASFDQALEELPYGF